MTKENLIKIDHLFIYRCIDRDALLRNCYKLNTFISRAEKQAKEYGKEDEDEINQYKGWALEFFAEYLIKAHPMDKRIGVIDYQIVDEDDDTGVDGYGTGLDGNPATVQVKWRPFKYTLTANRDHLTNFTSSSLIRYGVKLDENRNKNMLIITTGKDIHWRTDEKMFQYNVRVLNREKLRVLVDENNMFWDYFRDSWEYSLPKTKIRKPKSRKLVRKKK